MQNPLLIKKQIRQKSIKFGFNFLLMFALFYILFQLIAVAQQPDTNNKPTPPETKETPSKWDFVLAAFAAAASLICNVVQAKITQQIRKGINDPVRLPAGNRRSSVILIGVGDTGKSTFIKTLLSKKDIEVTKTKKYKLYSGSIIDEEENRNTQYRFYIADYKGQNLATLISAFIWQQKWQYSPMAYGHITSLVLIVDLFDRKSADKTKPDEEIRVKKHLEQWNDTALDAVWGLLRIESLKYVCLFINKLDSMADSSPMAQARYTALYDALATRLVKRIKPENIKAGVVDFEVVLGSAKTGANVSQVKRKLMEHSVDGHEVTHISENETSEHSFEENIEDEE